ncbi:hypothetical protein QQ045_013209 [Rhodiola kirilowii]
MEAENALSAAVAHPPPVVEKLVMIFGIDESEHSYYVLEWTLDHFFGPFAANQYPFKLLILHSKPIAAYTAGLAGIGGVDILAHVEADLKKVSARVAEKALEICATKSVVKFFFNYRNYNYLHKVFRGFISGVVKPKTAI